MVGWRFHLLGSLRSESVRWELQRAGALVPDNGASGASSEWRGVGRNAEEKFGSVHTFKPKNMRSLGGRDISDIFCIYFSGSGQSEVLYHLPLHWFPSLPTQHEHSFLYQPVLAAFTFQKLMLRNIP